MTIFYKIEYDEVNNRPAVNLSLPDKTHIGTVWGKLERPTDPFDVKRNIIRITDPKGITVATFWDAKEATK